MPGNPDAIPVRNKQAINRLIPLLIFTLALAARLLPGARTIDDSYITYRYVRNILAGNGFVYNPGEQVLGTTTPLYTILLTGAGVFAGGEAAPFPQISLALNALADGITCLLLWRLGRQLGYALAGLGAALIWAIAPYSVTFAIGGLETSLYVLLLVGAVSAHIARKHVLTAFLAALMLLTRPDALILIGPLGLDRAWQIYRHSELRPAKRRLALEVLAFLLPTLVWIGFSSAYFGSPLPHSITAKSLAYRLPENSALVRLLQHYSTIFLEELTFGVPWMIVGFVLYPFLYLVGARQAFRASARCWPFLAYPWLYLITFAAANPLIFRWYLTPPLPALMLVVLIGVEHLVKQAAGLLRRRQGQPVPVNGAPDNQGVLLRLLLLFFVILAPIALTLRGWQVQPDHGLPRPAPEMAWYLLELRYRQAADYLVANFKAAPESITLAAGDVGVLGYFTGARILDTVGLNSPQATRYYPLPESYHVNAYAVSPDLILDERPDYLVILEVYGRNGLLKDTRFLGAYELIHTISTDIYDSRGMLIFARKLAP
jgi:hypothetical protein